MTSERAHVRNLLPWLLSFTLIGLIDAALFAFMRFGSFLHVLRGPVEMVQSVANRQNIPEALLGLEVLLHMVYVAPYTQLLSRLALVLGGGNWGMQWQVSSQPPIYVAPFLLLNSIVAVALVVSLARRLLTRGKSPGSANAHLLQKPSWIVPYFLGYSIIVFLHVVAFALLIVSEARMNQRETETLFLILLYVGAGFGLLGAIWGFRFNRASKTHVTAIFASNNLPDDHPIAARTRALSARLGLPPPAVGVMQEFNAFAVGPSQKDAAVVLGQPLVETLTDAELNAVIGHELGHIVTADMQRMQMAAGFQRMFDGFIRSSAQVTQQVGQSFRSSEARLATVFSLLGIYLVRWFVTFLARVATMAFSRSREYRADAVGAALTSPEAMISALQKVHNLKHSPTVAEDQYGYLMFRPARMAALFATHPSAERRIAALRKGTYRVHLPADSGRSGSDAFGFPAQPAMFVAAPAPTAAAPVLTPSPPALRASPPRRALRPSPIIRTLLSGPSRKAWWGLGATFAGMVLISFALIAQESSQRSAQRRLDAAHADLASRLPLVQQREAAATARERALHAREQEAGRQSFTLADRTRAVHTRETQVADREVQAQKQEAELRAQRQTLEPELARLAAARDAAAVETARLNAERNAVANERQRLETQRQQLAAEQHRLDGSRRAAEQAMNDAATARQRLDQERTAAVADLSRAQTVRQELSALQARATSDQQAADAQRRANEARAGQIQADLQRFEEARRAAERSTAEAFVARQQLENDRRMAGPELQRLQRERQDLEGLRAALGERESRLSASLSQLASDRAAIQGKEAAADQRSAALREWENRLVSEWNAVLASAPGNVFGALAVDRAGTWWFMGNMNSLRAARQSVQQACEQGTAFGNCIITSVVSQCISLAQPFDNSQTFWATASSRREAGEAAVRHCRSGSGLDCRTSREQTMCSGVQ